MDKRAVRIKLSVKGYYRVQLIEDDAVIESKITLDSKELLAWTVAWLNFN